MDNLVNNNKKEKLTQQLDFEYINPSKLNNFTIIVNKEKFLEILTNLLDYENLNVIKGRILGLKDIITNFAKDIDGILNIESNGETISLRKDVLISELNQILESQTLERAKYYIERLKEGIVGVKTSKINDINLSRWKEYDEILTDSLWIFDKRETSGAHLAWYWGNFIPQIPHQMSLRYIKKGDRVL